VCQTHGAVGFWKMLAIKRGLFALLARCDFNCSRESHEIEIKLRFLYIPQSALVVINKCIYVIYINNTSNCVICYFTVLFMSCYS